MTKFDDSHYLHGLNLFSKFGPKRLSILAARFKDFQSAFDSDLKSLLKAGIGEDIAKEFLAFRPTVNLERELEKLEREHIKLLTFKDKNYPALLLEIPKSPPLLYFRGRMDSNDELYVAIVGTRAISSYGKMATSRITEPLVEAGAVIVSGMAFGVDAAAHSIAVNKNSRTIAVLGGGVDEKSLYPKHHALLAQQILDTDGALISEYPIGTPNFKQNFVARNRVISGLSLATIIIECDLKSGTLITAKHALDQNRQVYAVPGSIFSPQSQGPNNLLKMGAKPVMSANDILEDLNLKSLPEQKIAQKTFGDTKEETILLELLSYEPVLINDLIKQSGLEAGAVTSTLTFLEMKGRVRNLGGQQYVLSR